MGKGQTPDTAAIESLASCGFTQAALTKDGIAAGNPPHALWRRGVARQDALCAHARQLDEHLMIDEMTAVTRADPAVALFHCLSIGLRASGPRLLSGMISHKSQSQSYCRNLPVIFIGYALILSFIIDAATLLLDRGCSQHAAINVSALHRFSCHLKTAINSTRHSASFSSN